MSGCYASARKRRSSFHAGLRGKVAGEARQISGAGAKSTAMLMTSAAHQLSWAGIYALPHTWSDAGALSAGMFAAPFVALAIALPIEDARALHCVCAGCVPGFFAVAAVHANLISLDRAAYDGLRHRVKAVLMLVPSPAVAGWDWHQEADTKRPLHLAIRKRNSSLQIAG